MDTGNGASATGRGQRDVIGEGSREDNGTRSQRKEFSLFCCRVPANYRRARGEVPARATFALLGGTLLSMAYDAQEDGYVPLLVLNDGRMAFNMENLDSGVAIILPQASLLGAAVNRAKFSFP